jgi:arginine N-succinyltransferase
MFILREAMREDGEALLKLARHLDTVNLPASAERLERIVDHSVRSFSGELEPAAREYVFALENIETGEVIGTSMIHAQHGTRRAPHVYFQIIADERYSESLDRYFVHQCLRIGYNYDGPTEIGGLILLPEYRGRPSGLGKLLSYARFVYMAMHRQVFRDQVISELLPPLEPDGTSVLWEHLGKKFTGLTYQEADLLSKDNKEFIRSLFPHDLIYVALLPDEVAHVIGQVGPNTRGVERMLRRIGFDFANQIDPFDGGPHFIASTDDISLIRGARQLRTEAVESADNGRPWAVVATAGGASGASGFRAAYTRVIPDQGETLEGCESVGLSPETLAALRVRAGDRVWAAMP